MRAQSVSPAVRARAWQAAIAACSAYGPTRAAERFGALERGEAAADQQLVPAARGSGRAAGSARPTARRARATREAWISISATRPCTSGSSGASSARMRPSRSASSQSAGPHPVVAGGRGVALVEDQVDDLEHRGEARGELGAARHLERARCASASVRLARTMRWAIGRLGHEEGARDLVGGQAAEQAQRERDARLGREHRVAGGEHSRSRSSPMSSSSAASRSGVGRCLLAPRARGRAPRACARAACRGAAGRWRGAWRWP